MFTGIIARTGHLVATIALFSGAAILHGGAAAANSSQDDQFVALLNQEGIAPISGVPALIDTAHQVCALLGGGMSPDAVVQRLVHNANAVTPGRDPGRVARSETLFVKAAVGAYCPDRPAA